MNKPGGNHNRASAAEQASRFLADPFAGPRAAWGPFPYPGRNLAEVDSDEAARRARLFGTILVNPTKIWCDQCEKMVSRGEPTTCRSQFCSIRKAA